jgi:predicted nucleic acid-binding protein
VGTVVLDASALIAFFDASDALHQRAHAMALEWRGHGVTRMLPASVYSEVLVAPSRARVVPEWEADFAALDIEVVPIDAAIARVAAKARATRKSLRLPDALVIATALVHGAELVTLDRRMSDAHRALAGA